MVIFMFSSNSSLILVFLNFSRSIAESFLALKSASASGVVDQMQTKHDETEKLLDDIIQAGSLSSSYAWLIARSFDSILSNNFADRKKSYVD